MTIDSSRRTVIDFDEGKERTEIKKKMKEFVLKSNLSIRY